MKIYNATYKRKRQIQIRISKLLLQYFIADYLQIEKQCKDNCKILLSGEIMDQMFYSVSLLFSE